MSIKIVLFYFLNPIQLLINYNSYSLNYKFLAPNDLSRQILSNKTHDKIGHHLQPLLAAHPLDLEPLNKDRNLACLMINCVYNL